jgi:uncharacterized membrane protein YdfJ with MMPL/SSD domain
VIVVFMAGNMVGTTAISDVDQFSGESHIRQLGDASANKAINKVIGEDLAKAGELSLPLTLIILTITFGTLVAAGLPLLIGLTAVLAALGLVALPSRLLPVDANLPAVILLIGLAVGVDYSLFYLRREREERAAGRSERSALETAAATSGRAVLISGVTVIVAMAGMFISGDKSFISFAEGAIVVVAIAVFASLTVLPAALSWLGDRVEKGRVPLLGRRRRPAGRSRFWTALTGRVMRRPGLSILLAGGLLVALSGNDAASTRALSVLRDQIVPATVGRAAGATVNVSGEAASSKDFASQLASRLALIRELHDRGMTTDEAVKQGISTTAGTVTSAAAVLVGVFAVFVTLSFLDFKELGLAAAVLIDATIVRGVLLPASMKLLGEWNWYLPRWLEWLPHVGAEGDAALPVMPEEPPGSEEPGAAEEPRPAPVPA